MRFIKSSGTILVAGFLSLACAADTEGAPDERDNGSTATGGSHDPGVPGAGGTDSVPGAGGQDSQGTGGTDVGTGGTTQVTAGPPCAEGTVDATSPPTILTWEEFDGETSTEVEGASGSLTADPTGTKDPYLAAVLTPWAKTGRQCLKIPEDYTGVQFDITGTASYLAFKIGVSATDPSGHCAAECYGHPEKQIDFGTGVQVAFADLAPPTTWGNGAPFDRNQVISLMWATTDKNASYTVSNISFY